MLQGRPIFLRLAPSRGKGISIQGAISNLQREFIWSVSDGNDGYTFKKFVRKVAAWAINPAKTVLVMDNATYHQGQALKEYCKEKGLGLLFTPSASSDLNPVGKSTLQFLALNFRKW